MVLAFRKMPSARLLAARSAGAQIKKTVDGVLHLANRAGRMDPMDQEVVPETTYCLRAAKRPVRQTREWILNRCSADQTDP